MLLVPLLGVDRQYAYVYGVAFSGLRASNNLRLWRKSRQAADVR